MYIEFESFFTQTLYEELDREDPENILFSLKITIINLIYNFLIDKDRSNFDIPTNVFVAVVLCYMNEGNNICLRLTALKCITVALTYDMQLLANLPDVMKSTFNLMATCSEIESK